MKLKCHVAVLLASSTFLFAGHNEIKAETVTVFAAASLTDSLKEIASGYEQATGDKIVFNFAASGTLARQIEAGAPADIFFSADEAKADVLTQKGLLVTGTRKSLLYNSLVIVANSDHIAMNSPNELANASVQRVALGDLKIVPAGSYAKEYFQAIGLWQAIEPKVVPCENVRAVLAAVESGNVDAGVVYKTDAAISKKVKIVFEVPATAGPKISYPVALVSNGPQPAAARKFLNFLQSGKADAVFLRYGFVIGRL